MFVGSNVCQEGKVCTRVAVDLTGSYVEGRIGGHALCGLRGGFSGRVNWDDVWG